MIGQKGAGFGHISPALVGGLSVRFRFDLLYEMIKEDEYGKLQLAEGR